MSNVPEYDPIDDILYDIVNDGPVENTGEGIVNKFWSTRVITGGEETDGPSYTYNGNSALT